ncbi:amidase [Burkholderia sp. Ac-20379]|uniref:amidase n=1 Tax=Burkholderia sp. Ac-20379 TaxID=2703900 RepID=UPI0019821EAB|nr:amidase [Burkholderia sp. Ac-20379]MBN3724475.1 amidase [Burkholderia sp. Ac-20379]
MTIFTQTLSLGGERTDSPTIAIKDTIDIAGYPTVCGSRALAGAAPARHHAEAVQRVLDAGWRIVGKTTTHELAYGMTGINDFAGTPLNPQGPAHVPGGSSSGSAAAVGFKLADAALGTDTGGSVRGPAACCGVMGLKPTFGRVSRLGVAPADSTLDCVGPLARDVDTLVRVMLAIAPDFDAAAARGHAATARIGIATVAARPEIAAAVARAVHASGNPATAVTLDGFGEAFDAGLAVINAENARAFAHLLGRGWLGADVETRLQAATATTPDMLAAANRVRARFIEAVDRTLDAVDVIVMPTLPDFPITVEAARSGASVITMSSLIRPFNLSGHPALSLPIEVDTFPLRAGLQIVGRRGDDERVCAVAAHVAASLAR